MDMIEREIAELEKKLEKCRKQGFKEENNMIKGIISAINMYKKHL